MYKKLPHFSQIGQYQFITFRTKESIDSYVKKIYDTQNLSLRKQEYLADVYLDSSKQGAYLFGEALECLVWVLYEYEKRMLYKIVSFAIMPNHVHLLIEQKTDLQRIIKTIKAVSSKKINALLGKDGTFWSEYYFDKAIRDEKHMNTVQQYILDNPIKANLEDARQRVYSKWPE